MEHSTYRRRKFGADIDEQEMGEMDKNPHPEPDVTGGSVSDSQWARTWDGEYRRDVGGFRLWVNDHGKRPLVWNWCIRYGMYPCLFGNECTGSVQGFFTREEAQAACEDALKGILTQAAISLGKDIR
jgi:hypothetical protein